MLCDALTAVVILAVRVVFTVVAVALVAADATSVVFCAGVVNAAHLALLARPCY